MSSVTTYQSLHTDSFISVNLDFAILKQNFLVLNEFIKNFTQFQKKFIDMQKTQKAIAEDLSAFKINTQSQFSTMNQILQSRNQITQGKSSTANEQLNDIKKSIKELKLFMTESTRQEHQAQQIRQNQQQQINRKLQTSIKQMQSQHSSNLESLTELSSQLNDLSLTMAKKSQVTQLSFSLQKQKQKTAQLQTNIDQLSRLLKQTKVEEFKAIIDEINQRTKDELNEMKVKFNVKCNQSDLLKLEQMILGIIQFSYQDLIKTLANKQQTKKALIFLEKRLNSLLITLLGDDQNDREALLTAKNFKCISCTKDLGQMEGKIGNFKPWSLFPVKQPNTKDKYSGFGAGFQSIVETTVAKKGGEVAYDQKGRMVAPFNLTSTLHGSFMKTSKSQHKIQASQSKSKLNISPNKNSLKYQTNFMYQFGKDSGHQSEGNITGEYFSQYKGLQNVMLSNGKTYQQGLSSKEMK